MSVILYKLKNISILGEIPVHYKKLTVYQNMIDEKYVERYTKS